MQNWLTVFASVSQFFLGFKLVVFQSFLSFK